MDLSADAALWAFIARLITETWDAPPYTFFLNRDYTWGYCKSLLRTASIRGNIPN